MIVQFVFAEYFRPSGPEISLKLKFNIQSTEPSVVTVPVFSLSSNAQFLDVSLDSGQGFGRSGIESKLSFHELIEILQGFWLHMESDNAQS